MSKTKVAFVCRQCGGESSKWLGQCPHCQAWNTLEQVNIAPLKASAHQQGYATGRSEVQSLAAVNTQVQERLTTGFGEFDRVLGGGLVSGAAVLLGGHPGAGKSTLLLQTSCALAAHSPVLYVTGEESLEQVALRGRRLRLALEPLQALAETSVERIIALCQELKPKVLIIDSIQVMYVDEIDSAPGSVAQVREAAARLTRFAKQTGTILLLIGHVTKEGSLAGPKVLEHMIDASIMLESSADSRYRTLRAIKNRFGAVNELGVFAMLDQGMREVKNPSAIFLSAEVETAAGSLVTLAWEGTRPLLVELQSLVDTSHGGMPRRVTLGLDSNRLNMLLAVLHRHGGVFSGDQDVFINVVGGLKIQETSADLAMILAVVSSLRNRIIGRDLVVFGEVGLSGEVRPVANGQERLREAAKHGFKRAIIAKGNLPKQAIPGLQIHAISRVQEALDLLSNE